MSDSPEVIAAMDEADRQLAETMQHTPTWADPTHPRKLERILAHRIPSQQLDPYDPRNLWHVPRIQAELDAATRLMVETARHNGQTWSQIGDQLGITKQAAQQRYGGKTA